MNTASELSETVLVPLTGYVRMPLPSRQERAEFIASLEAESARIKGGDYTTFAEEDFLAQLREGYAEHLRTR